MVERVLYGRKTIYTDVSEVTRENVVAVIDKAMTTHRTNRSEIDYLWRYYKGEQPILARTKKVRPEICNKIIENRANEIVSFKVGYLFGEPIQYIGRRGEGTVPDGISQLNEMMFCIGKSAQDREIGEWQMVCGTAYRAVFPDSMIEEDDVPFEMFTLDPRDTYVVYSNEVGNRPVLAVKYSTDENGSITYSAYSDKKFWKIKDGQVEEQPHILEMIPIIEYPANNAKLGSFEIVLPLLDALNKVASNRMDGIEQFIQAFVKFVNCDIDEEQFKALKELGAIKVKSVDGTTADVDIVTSELNQAQTQITKDDLYQSILTICGIPSMSDGSTSDSSNNGAVILKNGWQGAETRAKDSELMFKQAEKNVLKLVLKICRDTNGAPSEVCSLRLKDIDMSFTRRNYEAIQSKSQVLISMLKNPKIHPQLAFAHCGMFSDVEDAYSMSMKYYEEQLKKSETQSSEDLDKDIDEP